MYISNIKEKFLNKEFFKLALKKLILLIGIIIFIILFSGVFGKENQLIGVGVITGLLMFKNIGLGINKKQAPFIIILICLVMAICNIFSFYNIYLAIFLNAFAVFFLMLFSTIRLHYRTYIPFILMYIFAQDSNIPEGRILYRFLAFFISGILIAFSHYIYNKNDENLKNAFEIIKDIKLERDKYIFIIKSIIGITVAMLFSDIMGLEKGMWIVITVMSLTQPDFKTTEHRIKARIKGTFIGFILYLILFKLFVPEIFISILALFISYIYSFIKEYYIQIIFITITSLNAASDIFETHHSIILRILFVSLGSLIAFIIIFFEKKFLDKNFKADINIVQNKQKQEHEE